jgi:hypothetical protein
MISSCFGQKKSSKFGKKHFIHEPGKRVCLKSSRIEADGKKQAEVSMYFITARAGCSQVQWPEKFRSVHKFRLGNVWERVGWDSCLCMC